MNKKKIISTTILFVAIVASIIIFKSIFGEFNSLVAVTGVTAALSLLGNDYTLNPIKNTIYFVCLEVVLGLAAFFAGMNALLGLIITFCIVFYILYTFTYEHKQPTYVGFTLGYFFMLYSPVTAQELPLRIVGLVVCGLAIMVLQFLVNRNGIKKQTQARMKVVLSSVKEEVRIIESMGELGGLSDLNHTAYTALRGLIEKLYEAIDKGAKLPTKILEELFIAHFLDSLNIKIKESIDSHHIEKIKNIHLLSQLLNQIEQFTEGDEDINALLDDIEQFIQESRHIESKSYLDIELNAAVAILRKDLKNVKANDVDDLYSQYFITNLGDKLTSFKNNISKESVKFTFAFRGALITSIGVFIVSAFNIVDGRWIIFSLHAIVQPYLDYSKKKGHQRVMGTIIGLIIFEIVFSIITDTTLRMLVLLLAGYISNYQTNYRNQVICITISALGAASIGVNINEIGIERLIYVIAGTLVALYANKVILPYKVSDATKANLKKSMELNKKIIGILYDKCIETNTCHNEFTKLIHVNKFIINRLEYNNNLLSSQDIKDYLYNQHIFMNDVRILSNVFNKLKREQYNHLKLLKDIEYLKHTTKSREEALQYLDHIDDILSQLVIINMLNIKENMDLSDEMYKTIINTI